MKTFIITVVDYGPSAQHKAGIVAASSKGKCYVIHAGSQFQAYSVLCNAHKPQDERPISGKSYIKELKIGTAVRLLNGYRIGFGEHGEELRAFYGHVSEIINDNAVSVSFKGYANPFVDFGFSEIGERWVFNGESLTATKLAA